MEFNSTFSFVNTGNNVINSENNLDTCTMIAWGDLVGHEVDDNAGDEWLYLCGDIDAGEIYRDWFIWEDKEVTQNWEAYDPITNQRYVAKSLELIKETINQIEAGRNLSAETEIKKSVSEKWMYLASDAKKAQKRGKKTAKPQKKNKLDRWSRTAFLAF